MIYYSPKGYWKGIAAISKLAAAAKVSEEVAQAWLKKQAIWQIYLPAPQHVPRPKFDVPVPNEVHQADLLFLPHDPLPRGRKTYKYALTVVDVASPYKEAEPLTSKSAAEVADALERIYKRSPLGWPKLLQVDPACEFMGAVSQLLAKHIVSIRRGRVDINRDQGIIERFNRTLAERLFGHQYAQEMRLPEGERSTEWVGRLPAVVAALNREVTRLTGQKSVMRSSWKAWHKSPLLLSLVAWSASRNKSFRPASTFAICTSLASWKGGTGERLIPFGPSRCTGSDAQWPSQWASAVLPAWWPCSRPTYSSITRPAHSSFILPKPSCWPCCA